MTKTTENIDEYKYYTDVPGVCERFVANIALDQHILRLNETIWYWHHTVPFDTPVCMVNRHGDKTEFRGFIIFKTEEQARFMFSKYFESSEDKLRLMKEHGIVVDSCTLKEFIRNNEASVLSTLEWEENDAK